jgi:hypothetical protein
MVAGDSLHGPADAGNPLWKGVDWATLGMKTDDVRAALGLPPSQDGTRAAPVYEYYGGALRVLFDRGRVTRFGAVMTYFAIKGGQISNVKLGRVVFAKYDPFFGLLL